MTCTNTSGTEIAYKVSKTLAEKHGQTFRQRDRQTDGQREWFQYTPHPLQLRCKVYKNIFHIPIICGNKSMEKIGQKGLVGFIAIHVVLLIICKLMKIKSYEINILSKNNHITNTYNACFSDKVIVLHQMYKI